MQFDYENVTIDSLVCGRGVGGGGLRRKCNPLKILILFNAKMLLLLLFIFEMRYDTRFHYFNIQYWL